MSEQVSLSVDGKTIVVPNGTTVAVAVALAGGICRRSVTGEARSAVCGMGICFECRVTIGGEPHRRSCQILCEQGMDVKTHGFLERPQPTAAAGGISSTTASRAAS